MNATGSARFHRLLAFLGLVLNETLMGLLAIAAFGTALWPELFDVSDRVAAPLEEVESAIVAVFVAEYVVHLLLAPNKNRRMSVCRSASVTCGSSAAAADSGAPVATSPRAFAVRREPS